MDSDSNGSLTPEQALQNLDNAAGAIQGNRQAHILLQQSVELLRSELRELARLRNSPE